MRVRIGDLVRVRVAPDVDPSLWDAEGLVADVRRDNRVVVEFGDGADCTVNPDQIDLVEETDPGAPFRGTAVEPHG